MLEEQLAEMKFDSRPHKFGKTTQPQPQPRPHKTTKQLFEMGRKCFMMMIEPQNVPFKTERERREFDRGYYKTKIKFIQNNPLIPEIFREIDRARPKNFFKPRARIVLPEVTLEAA